MDNQKLLKYENADDYIFEQKHSENALNVKKDV